jgi:hypothetical protein
MLPQLTPLQYLVLHLLFVGRQSGDELRRTLRALGLDQSRPSFSQMMARLIEANYVAPQSAVRNHEGQAVHHRCYEITDWGVHDWTAARKFYLNLTPPSHDLLPLATQSGQLAAYDPQTRQAAIRSEVEEHVRRFASAVLDVDVKPPRKNARRQRA